jgi:hypothetical protein
MKMEFTKEEKDKLEQAKCLFSVDNLSQKQIELIIGRKIVIRPAVKNDDKVYSIKRLFKPPHQKALPNFDFKQIAQHAANKGPKNTRRLQLQKHDNTYRITKLFRDKKAVNTKLKKLMNIIMRNIKHFVQRGRFMGM